MRLRLRVARHGLAIGAKGGTLPCEGVGRRLNSRFGPPGLARARPPARRLPVRLDWSIMGCTMRLRALMNLGRRGGREAGSRSARRARRRRQHRGQRPQPATHQLFTCRMVSPVSCASCFFCSSEGYGCCGHHKSHPTGPRGTDSAAPLPATGANRPGGAARVSPRAGCASPSALLVQSQGLNPGLSHRAASPAFYYFVLF